MGVGNMEPEQEKKKTMEEIGNIKSHLVSLGYNPLEVDWMIATLCNNRRLSELNLEGIRKVREALREQLRMAEKCIEVIHNMRTMPN